MYVPQESLSLSVEEASKDKNLVRRLEGKIHHILITSVYDLIHMQFSHVQKLDKKLLQFWYGCTVL